MLKITQVGSDGLGFEPSSLTPAPNLTALLYWNIKHSLIATSNVMKFFPLFSSKSFIVLALMF